MLCAAPTGHGFVDRLLGRSLRVLYVSWPNIRPFLSLFPLL
jgi:hypothetical protein